MAEFDDLLGTQQQPEAPAPEQPFDKEAWAATKKLQREALYTLADTTALDVADDPERFTQYLDVQARFDRYSATNALLVLAQRPEATQLGDLDHWKKERVFIKPSEMQSAVLILAPGKEYHREDGSVGTGVDVKRVYDMSQAERPRLQPVPKHDDKALVRAVVHASPVPVEGVDDLGGPDAQYSPEQGKILVQRGMDAPAIVRAVAREACYSQMDTTATDNAVFDSNAGAYLICKKFGVDVQDMSFPDVQARFDGMEEAKDVRDTLSGIRNAAGEISKSMAKELEPPKREARE